MSLIVETLLGRFRAVSKPSGFYATGERTHHDRWLWECPGCKRWCHLSERQWKGNVSVDHASDGCPGKYHETHDFETILAHELKQTEGIF